MKKIVLSRLHNNRGSVLLVTYFLIATFLIFGAAFLVMSSTDARRAAVQHKTDLAFYIAEAGIEKAIYDLKQEYESPTGDKDWSNGITVGSDSWGPDISDFYDIYLDGSGDPKVTYPLDLSDADAYQHAFSPTNVNNYQVKLMNAGGEDIWIRSTGEVDGVTQTIQVYVRVINISPWNNAIFGGAGGSGEAISGDVDIFGSVHILGNGLDPGDDAIVLSGNTNLVGNYYKIGPTDLPQALKDKIPDLPTTILNEGTADEETVHTLSAEIRVKKGYVSLSGNSTVGEENDDSGNDDKETIDGSYVTDGYTGSGGEDSVYADNGTNEGYDLGDAITFPSLSDNYPGTSVDYYSYFTTNGLVLSAGELDGLDSDSTTPVTLGDCASNCVTTDGLGGIRVEGLIYVTGDDGIDDYGLEFVGARGFEYTGKGTILVSGDGKDGNANIQTSFVTSGNDSFPTNIIAFMTPNDMNIGLTAQVDVMGLFFAEGKVAMDMQTNIIGTIFSNYFDVGDQTPGVFQVPLDEDDYPDGLIQDQDIWFTKVVSWQKCDSHAATCGGV